MGTDGATTDCVVVTPDDGEGTAPVERVERAVTTLDGTPVVAVAADERLDDLLATGVDDVVTDGDLDRRGALVARRIVRLARAHRATTAAPASPADPGRPDATDRRRPRPSDRPDVRADLVGRDREFLYSFLDVTMDPEASFDEQAGALLELCCDTLGFDVGVLSRVSDHDYEIRAVHAPGEHISAGESFDLEDTYCKHVVDTASVEWFFDAVDAGRVESRSYTSTGHEAFLGLPVTVGDDLYGTLCLTSEESRSEPITDADVALARLVTEWVGSDLLRARRQRELESLTERLESLVETTPLAIVGLTPDRTVTKWNAAAESMFGWEAEEVLGEDYPLIPVAESASAEGLHDRTFSGERFHGREIRRKTRSGEVLDLRLSTAPVRAEGDGYQEVWGVIDDVTENREFERKLRALQTTTNRLNVAADAEAVVDVTIEAAAEVLGYPLATFWSYDDSSGTLVPATRSEQADRRFESLPSFAPGDGRLWEVFSTGEPEVYSDLSRVDDRY